MKLALGRQTDNGLIDQRAGSWRGGRNAIIKSGKIFNEPGFEVVINTLPGTNIGNIVLDSNLVAFFQVNGSNSEIYIADLTAKTIRLITSNTDFGFDINHPVSGEYYRNSKGEIVITWTNDFTAPRIMNIETTYGSAIDKLTRVYLKYRLPKLSSSNVLDTGGALLSGAHFISTAYISIDESQTPYSPVLGPFYITDNTRAEIGPKYDGAPAGTQTSKALSLHLTDVDTDYQYLVIALVSKIGGVTTSKQVKKILISSNTIDTVISGAENTGTVAIEDIIIGEDVYDKVKAITQIDNQLFMANLSKEEELRFQLAALDIIVNYETTLVDINATDDSNPKLKPTRGFMHNEVAALYIHLVKGDGTITKGFHIPGRNVAIYNNADYPEFNGILENQVVTVAAGLHIDRAVSIGGSNSKIFQFFDTADNTNASTNMQYWENDELYPMSSEFGSLQGKPVRHHKFPSISHLKTTQFNSDPTYGSNRMTRLNVKLTNVVLPTGYVGYFVSAAKRTFSNSTIIAQDILLHAARRGEGATSDNLYWTSSGNWTASTLSHILYSDHSYIRIHAFDLFIDRPSVAPNYIEAELTIRNRDIGVRYDFGSKLGGSILQSGGFYRGGLPATEVTSLNGVGLSDDNKKQDLLVIDETKGDINITVTLPKNRFVKASEFKYLPGNTSNGLGIFMNLNSEECAVLKLDNGEIFGASDLVLHGYDVNKGRKFDQFTGGVGASGKKEEVTYLYNIKQYKSNMYENMFTQDLYLVHDDMIEPIDNTTESSIIGGDVIVSDMSFYTYGPNQPLDSNPVQGIRVARRHIVESSNFASYRYLGNNSFTYFYPEIDPFPALMFDKSVSQNQWAYNKDYTSLNDINLLQSNDPIANLDFNTLFPYRIIRSDIDQVEERGINNWRTFPVRNYYEMPKHRGEIINIKGVGELLVINQRYAFSRTRNNVKLATSEGDVIAGTGDIFKIPPEELTPTEEGYAGCQNKFGCLLTKAGYIFTDAEQGKVFLLAESLEEISAKGNVDYFRPFLLGVGDNPFTSTGLTIGWDDLYKRIILSRTDGTTISYSLEVPSGGWVFEHDYNPNSMLHTRFGLYSLKDGVIYRNDSSIKRGIYYTDTIYPMSIAVGFNQYSKAQNYRDYQDGGENRSPEIMFTDIKWKSEVINFNSGIQTKETFTQLFIYNSFQGTNLIDLLNYRDTINQYNLRKTGGIWHFNKFRDLVIDPTQPIANNFLPVNLNINVSKPFQYRRRFIDHYLVVNFIYDNQLVGGEQRNIYLYDVDVDFTPIQR